MRKAECFTVKFTGEKGELRCLPKICPNNFYQKYQVRYLNALYGYCFTDSFVQQGPGNAVHHTIEFEIRSHKKALN